MENNTKQDMKAYFLSCFDPNLAATGMVITALWEINQYTITFNTHGGTTIDPITQDYNTAVTEPADPTKT